MFIIFWRGRGYIPALAAVVALISAGLLTDLAKLPTLWSNVAYTGAMGVAGIAVWVLTRRIESTPGRVLIDKKTGREFTVKRGAGSLFFIPTRYWSYILPGLAAAVGIFNALKPTLR
jgi:hypothetical protein